VIVVKCGGAVAESSAAEIAALTKQDEVVVVHGAPGGAKVFEDIDEHRRTGLAKLLSRLTDAELSGLLAGHRALRIARAAAVAERVATEEPKP